MIKRLKKIYTLLQECVERRVSKNDTALVVSENGKVTIIPPKFDLNEVNLPKNLTSALRMKDLWSMVKEVDAKIDAVVIDKRKDKSKPIDYESVFKEVRSKGAKGKPN